eukprot:3732083-Lingulodinium_polyedra.AAC.1
MAGSPGSLTSVLPFGGSSELAPSSESAVSGLGPQARAQRQELQPSAPWRNTWPVPATSCEPPP